MGIREVVTVHSVALMVQHCGGSLPAGRAFKLRLSASQVLHARQLGINCIVVLEQYAELDVLLTTAHRMAVRPAIGIRAKLSTHHAG